MSAELLKLTYDWAKDVLFVIVILIFLSIFLTRGVRGLAAAVAEVFLQLPGVKTAAFWYLGKMLSSFIQQVGLGGGRSSVKSLVKALPEKGKSVHLRLVLTV